MSEACAQKTTANEQVDIMNIQVLCIRLACAHREVFLST
jgi:hypothetical protein